MAKQGYVLDILINDPSYIVRLEVAKQGYGILKLINDSSEFIKEKVIKYCIKNPINEEYKKIAMLAKI